LQADGQEFDSLNELFFQNNADISVEVVNGRRQITIRADIQSSEQTGGEAGQEISAEELQMMQSFGLGVVYRISGGEIISSNATRVEGNTAIWEFPTRIEVTLTEAAEFSPDAIALAAPPANSGFSPTAFEAIMESMAEGMAEDLETVNENSTRIESTTGNDSTQAEVTQESSANPAETSQTTTIETPGEGVSEESAEIAVESTDTTTAPPAEDSTLPASGGVLPGQVSVAQLFLAGLVLSIMGVGAAISLSQKNSE
jgi:hypothetical protein